MLAFLAVAVGECSHCSTFRLSVMGGFDKPFYRKWVQIIDKVIELASRLEICTDAAWMAGQTWP
jgi:hypothetical protein